MVIVSHTHTPHKDTLTLAELSESLGCRSFSTEATFSVKPLYFSSRVFLLDLKVFTSRLFLKAAMQEK